MNERWLIALFAAALAACSGASTQVVDTPPAGGGSTSSSSGAAPAAGNNGPSGGQGSSSGGSGQGSGHGTGSGSGDFDAGTAPTQCPSGGTEQTAADSQLNPTPFDTIACGALGAGQTYYWTFTLPEGTTTFGIAFTGGMQIALTIDGTTVNVVPGATLPFRTKVPYVLQVAPAGTSPESYVLVVTET